jgi:hypothetical protein
MFYVDHAANIKALALNEQDEVRVPPEGLAPSTTTLKAWDVAATLRRRVVRSVRIALTYGAL